MTHILIVDDNGDNLYYLKTLFESQNWEVKLASHGAEALKIASKFEISLIVSDLLMPVMDGYTLLKRWKSDEKLKKIPFIVYTATYTELEDERLALSLGADAFIFKPAEPNVFLGHVKDVLEKKKSVKPNLPNEQFIEKVNTTQMYSDILVRKLEDKTLQLEKINRDLLREKHELMIRDNAIQAVSQGIVITNPKLPDNPIIFASPGFKILTGYNDFEIVGKNCRFLQGENTDKETVNEIRNAIKNGKGCTVELLNYRKDGSTFWNQLTVSPVRDDEGHLINFVGVQSDVTVRKNLEIQLLHAQKMDAVGRLAGGVAHDFNNILASIGLQIEMILSKMDEDYPIKKQLQNILEVQKRGAKLTRQLLTFSRNKTICMEPTNVDTTINGVVLMLKPLISSNVELKVHLSPDEKVFLGDVGRFEQLITNLLLNARDAIENVGIVSITTKLVSADEKFLCNQKNLTANRYILISVEDNGCGMDANTVQKIFEPFFTTKAEGKGTGLGLSTVHGLVRQFNGFIEVESVLGKGSTFNIYLPQTQEKVVSQKYDFKNIDITIGKKTVLLVDDQVDLREILADALKEIGFDVLEAKDGIDALDIYIKNSANIDMVITDVNMPRMGGIKLIQNIKKENSKVKILLLSGYAEDDVMNEGINMGETHFIEKPFSINDFLKQIKKIMSYS